jgi:hypothetical protein
VEEREDAERAGGNGQRSKFYRDDRGSRDKADHQIVDRVGVEIDISDVRED